MATLSVATWIGNAAAVLSGRFGAISQRAKEADCSRQAMYNQAHPPPKVVMSQMTLTD